MEEEVGGAERIAHVEGERRTLGETDLERIDREAEVRRLDPGPLATVAPRDRPELPLQAAACLGARAREERLHRGADGGIGRRGRVDDEGAIVAIPVTVHVARDERGEGIPGAEAPEPVDADQIEEVVAEVVADLMTGVELRLRPFDHAGVARRVLEAADLVAVVREDIGEAPGEAGAEPGGLHPEGDLLALPLEIGELLRDAIELRRDAVRAGGDRAVDRDDAGRRHEDGTIPLRREGETLGGIEVEIDEALLEPIPRVGHLGGRGEAVVEDGAIPLDIAADRLLRAKVLAEEGDVGARVGEDAPEGAVGAGGGDGRRIEPIGGPIGDRGRATGAGEVLDPRREAGVVERTLRETDLRGVLEDPDATADHGARAAEGTLEAGDLRGLAVAPGESEPGGEPDELGDLVVAHAEGGLHRLVAIREVTEAIRIDAHAILQLEIAVHPVGITQRGARDPLPRTQRLRLEETGEGGGAPRFELRERVEAEGPEHVLRLLGGVLIAPELGGHLEPVLVVEAEPGELVIEGEGARRLRVVERGAPTEIDDVHPVGPVGEGRIDQDRAVGEDHVGLGDIARAVQPDVGLGEEDPVEVRVAELESSAGIRAIARVGGGGGGEPARRRLRGDTAVERDIERLPREGRRRGPIERAEDGELIVRPLIGDPCDGRRDPVGGEDREEAVHRVRRDAGGLQSDRARIQQRLQIVRPTPDLIGQVIEGLVEGDRPTDRAAERGVGILLIQRATSGIGPLEGGGIEIQARRADLEVRARATADVELSAGEATA